MAWDWNDLKHFLAVARSGSTLAGARSIGVNQTTCARRITALEAALNLQLFRRSPDGYRLTEAGTALVAHAERAEAAALAFEACAAQTSRASRSILRFSTSDVLAEMIGRPAIAAFAKKRPEVRVVLNVDSRKVDLAMGEADLALRTDPDFSDPNLIARKMMDSPWAVYCSAAYAADKGAPRDLATALAAPLAMLTGRPAETVISLRPDADIRFTTPSMPALVDAISSGDCISALPILVGDQTDLVKCFDLDIDAGGIWLLYHSDQKNSPNLRAFIDSLMAFIGEDRKRRKDNSRGDRRRLA